ncbi:MULTISPECIES: hypothetical protein [unclassified Arsukibacterium]|uniref:hypothetical protein n=1 Tax=unclassified Arsukibacterium TaxID=2635278 RepID=UPI000C4FD977|nr:MULTISPECIES: hypothetical protein [unclassified Arsukibacterium]MAA93081.1 hypothetical protein [Rheinheimera sp.]MBM35510.1 hypothetical protein [Rheinheimera sp.]HAW93577.1 hypothetical protein [Candidatus Azambacteria bacterium]|tara:strand:+ start:803 stop:1855 length:1053 start_codon:yes stop_codon:yes gene_type:complete
MAIEICITTNPVTREFIPCPAGHTLDEKSVAAAPLLAAGTPYITKSDNAVVNDSGALHFLEMLKQMPATDRRNIARLNKDFGTEVVDALAEFYQLQLKPALQSVNSFTQNTAIPYVKKEIPGFAGAAATALDSRLKNFASYIKDYQQALEQYRAAYINKVKAAEKRALAKKVAAAQAEVNRHFQGEIKRIMATNDAKTGNRGTVWSNPERAMGLARGSKTDAAIKLQSYHNVKRVQQFQRVANIAGKGLVVLDAGLRVNKVQDTYNQGGNWQKELAREMTGFGLGVIAGSIVGGQLTTTLTLILIATPYGWVIAIGAGLIAGLISAKFVDEIGKDISDVLWHSSTAIGLK